MLTRLRRLLVPGHCGDVIQRHRVVTGQTTMHHLTTTQFMCPGLHGTKVKSVHSCIDRLLLLFMEGLYNPVNRTGSPQGFA